LKLVGRISNNRCNHPYKYILFFLWCATLWTPRMLGKFCSWCLGNWHTKNKSVALPLGFSNCSCCRPFCAHLKGGVWWTIYIWGTLIPPTLLLVISPCSDI
jgi:hypothetical protein